ncbi:MAG: hypothetical protein COA79_02355 [Planctomycetota bacterium]|nr:MAG: hypothetical protein COA79_02355 [Planctomycetota bacterium]
MISHKVRRLGDILIEKMYISEENLTKAMEIKKKSPSEILGEVIVREGFSTEIHVLECIGEQLNLPFSKLTPSLMDQNIVHILPTGLMERYLIFPMFKVKNQLTIAMADPGNMYIEEEIISITNCQLNIIVATAQDILSMIDVIRFYETDSDKAQDEELTASSMNQSSDYQDFESKEQSPVVKIINEIISLAIKQNVSDIHFECDEASSKIRFRIDGILYPEKSSPKNLHAGIVSRIKLLSGMDIGEKRLPQDGRIQTVTNGQQIDMRVSSVPTNHGEKLVIRILPQNSDLLSLANINLDESNLDKIRREMAKPHGLFLVTGPTGSGKTTMMYSALNETADSTKNVCTVENPIEYDLNNVNQIQINTKAGLTFARCLRSILRQDPDVIMIGEIRDHETAEIAIQASLTGHLVLSTLHTNSTYSTVTRLMNIGIEPFLLGASLNGILSQRLVRKICNYCRYETTPTQAIREKLQIDEENALFYKGRGCHYCHGTGYKGRIAIHELFILNNDARDAISKGPNIDEMKEITKACQTVPLKLDGLLKAFEGLTTVEEILRVADDSE